MLHCWSSGFLSDCLFFQYDEPPTDNGTVTVGWLPCIEQISGLTQRGQMDISITKEVSTNLLHPIFISCHLYKQILQQIVSLGKQSMMLL